MKRKLKILIYIIIIVSFLVIAFYESSVFVFNHSNIDNLKKADAIIVLGSGYASSAKNRATAGLALYQKGLAPIIVLSGGKTNYPVSEAKFMADYIKSKSNEKINLLLEENSTSTYQNFQNVFNQINGSKKSIIFVSDNFHIFRSFLIAKSIGFSQIQWYSTENNGTADRTKPFLDNFNEFLKTINLLPVFLHLKNA
ncbi:MAG: YdcF family protein [bacterium]